MNYVTPKIKIHDKTSSRAYYIVNNITDNPLTYKITNEGRYNDTYAESVFTCEAHTICISNPYYLPAKISVIKEEEKKE
jgi:hypothetical protein